MNRKILYSLIVTIVAMASFIACSSSKKELFKETDAFVKSLQTTYQSYGILGDTNHAITTSDGPYTITPVGRLINVKIQKIVSNDEYERLRKDIEKHYKNDRRVNRVYICGGGTVMIDCRN